MKKSNFLVTAILSAGLVLALPGSDTNPGAFAVDTSNGLKESGTARAVRIGSTPSFGDSWHKTVRSGAILALDDGSAEIHTGSVTEPLVVANRFVPGERATLSAVSFYTSGAAAGESAEVIIYEDPDGRAMAPDPSMEVFRKEITLGDGGFQIVETDDLVLNTARYPRAAFFVGLVDVASGSFSLGIDMGGTGGGSFISEDGGHRFDPISAFPVIDGNAMIRAHRAGPIPSGHAGVGRLSERFRAPVRRALPAETLPAETGSFLHIMPSSDGQRESGSRATLINDRISASSGSESCPACAPALTPGYPRFLVGVPDMYEEYVTIENSSGSGIAMPIRTILTTLTPGTVEAYNPDGGGGRPPTGYWDYSLSTADGTDSEDDILDPGEKITRLWQIANDGGVLFEFWADVSEVDTTTKLLLHGDGHEGTIGGGTGYAVFDGDGDSVLVSDSGSLNATSVSLTGWVRFMSNASSNWHIFHKPWASTDIYPYTQYGMGWYSYEGNTLIFDGTVNGTLRSANSGITPQTHRWYFVVGVYDETDLTIYVDGEEQGTANAPGTFSLSQTQPIHIGRHGFLPWFMDAHLFDLAVYNRLLDPLEVTQLHQRGLQGLSNNITAGRVAYYPMESDFDDQSGYGNHGAPQGDAHTVSRSRAGRGLLCSGDPRVDGDTKKFGHYSMNFDGSGDYLRFGDGGFEEWDFGDGDFTIDFWFYPTAQSRMALFAFDTDHRLGIDFHWSGTRNVNIWASSTGSSWDLVNGDAGGNGIGSVSLDLNEWHHVAFVRSGDRWITFIDGVKDVDVTVSGSVVEKDEGIIIGRWGTGTYWLNGNIDEYRVSKGIARWTEDFTPATQPYEQDAFAKLLLHVDADDSAYHRPVMLYGDPGVGAIESKWSGSLSFDGSGDYLRFADSADWDFGSDDFTIDFWFYPKAESRMALFAFDLDHRLGIDFHWAGTRNVNLWASSTGTSWNLIHSDGGGNGIGSVSLDLNEWHHVAYVRSGNRWMSFIDGVRDVDVTVAGAVVERDEGINIGNWGGPNTFWLNGHVDEYRISRGIARWTENFTPDTEPYESE